MTTTLKKKRTWIDIEPSKQNLASFDLSKKVTNLLRHNEKLHREEDGGIQFYKMKFTIDTIFRIILSVNQLSIYGAVAAICEEFEAHQDRSGEPDVLMGQSVVLGESKAEVPLQNENPFFHQILWQQYEERMKSLSQESRVSKFCMEAGFVHVVEVGQY